jgi:hypothetical protein
MFDKPSDSAIGKFFDLGDELILWDINITNDNVVIGGKTAIETTAIVSRVDANEKFQVTSLGAALSRLAQHKDMSELPAVVRYEEVKGQRGNAAKALVFVRKYQGDEDIPL